MSIKYAVIDRKPCTTECYTCLYFHNYSTETNPRALTFGGHEECRSPRLNVQFLSEMYPHHVLSELSIFDVTLARG